MKYIKGNIKVIGSLVLILVLVLVYIFIAKIYQREKALNESAAGEILNSTGDKLSYTDIDGNPVSLNDYLGKILIVNSWASWSPFSATELGELSSVVSEYDKEEIKVIAINRAEPPTTAQRYLNTIANPENIFLVIDPEDKFYKSISGYAMPETVFYDKQGQIIHHNHGPMKREEIKLYLEQTIESSQQ